MSGSARDEAERLVATVLAMAGSSGARDQVGKGLSALAETLTSAVDRLAGAGSGGPHQPAAAQRGGWATGSAECCVCPVCKAIAAARNPSPATAVRLVTGAGDVATGAARLLRGLSSMAGARPKRAPAPPARPSPDEAWSAATREPANRPAEAWAAATSAAPDADPWAAASAAGAAAAEADRAEARARREAAETARVAAREAARRVAEAAALAEKAKGEAGGDAASSRTAEGFDVWAAATADAGVADLPRPAPSDHSASDQDDAV